MADKVSVNVGKLATGSAGTNTVTKKWWQFWKFSGQQKVGRIAYIFVVTPDDAPVWDDVVPHDLNSAHYVGKLILIAQRMYPDAAFDGQTRVGGSYRMTHASNYEPKNCQSLFELAKVYFESDNLNKDKYELSIRYSLDPSNLAAVILVREAAGVKSKSSDGQTLSITKLYSNKVYNFRFAYPADWVVEFENRIDSSLYGQPVRLKGPETAGFRPYLTIVSTIVKDDGKGLDAYMRNAESQLRDHFAKFELSNKKQTSILGWPAAWMIYRYQGDQKIIEELNVTMFIGKGQMAMIQFLGESNKTEADKIIPIFESVIESLCVGAAGIRLPFVKLTDAKNCSQCEITFKDDDDINAMINLSSGQMHAICSTCRNN